VIKAIPRISAGLVCAALLGHAGCSIRPAEERAQLDSAVGIVHAGGVTFRVEGGLAAVRHASPGQLTLWAQSPVLTIRAKAEDNAVEAWEITIANALTTATISAPDVVNAVTKSTDAGEPATLRRWGISLPAGDTVLRIGPPDAAEAGRFYFAVLSDIQEALDDVHEIFAHMNADPSLQFVISTGDLTRNGTANELEAWEAQLENLAIPFYSTVGNHELGARPVVWHQRFGRFSFQFWYRQTVFTLVDSANATIDPLVHEMLSGWLDQGRNHLHVFLTHEPIFDPVGTRQAGFRSRDEAAKLVAKLGEHQVDLLFFGHVHSYYAYSLGGVPAYISGGGGAIPERFDGIGRHYLRVEAEPAGQAAFVSVVRVD
jgi:3',5'-cyclic-AMP phosphodiesterase